MRRSMTNRSRSFAGLLAMLALASPAMAQLPNASSTALGMGDNYTALARGFAAVGWNPANLGLSGNPGGSFALFSTAGVTGLGPIDFSDTQEYEGQLIPNDVKQLWLDEITGAGGEEGSAGGSITYLAAQVGRFGFQLATDVHLGVQVGAGAAELLLFGNAGRTGDPVDVTLGSSFLDAAATSTAAVSFAQPISVTPSGRISIGATAKYTVGHVMLTGMDLESRLDADPLRLDLNFPLVQTDTAVESLNSGSGVGLDLGIGWEDGPLTVTAAVRNVFHTFEWDREQLHFRPGRVLFDPGESTSDFDAQPFTSAPVQVQERVDDIDFSPLLAAGFGYRVSPDLLVGGDVRQRLGDSILMGPATHAGLGLEYTGVGFLPIRLGAGVQSGGYLVSGGIGLSLGGFNIGVAGVIEETELGAGERGMFTISGGAR